VRKQIYKVLQGIFIVILSLTAKAKDYPLRHYTVADGLPSNEVYHVFQDSKGYIWFGTDNGVARYNGDEFRVYTKRDGLTDNTVFEIFEDSNGEIWFIGISGQLSIYSDNSIKPYRFNHILPQLPTNETIIEKNSFYADSSGTVSFLSRSHGLKVISPEGVLSIIDSLSFSERPQWYVVDFSWRPVVPVNCSAKNKNIILYTGDSLTNSLTIKSDTFFLPPSARHWEDKYIIHGNKLLCIASKEQEIHRRLFYRTILFLDKPNEDEVWIGQQNGGAKLLELPSLKTKLEIESLKNNSVTSVLTDAEGGIWFSTLSEGVFYLNPPESRLSKLNFVLPSKAVKSLDPGPDSSVYIGYWKPFFSILSETGIKNVSPDVYNRDDLTNFFYDKNEDLTYATGSTKVYYFKPDELSFSLNNATSPIKEYTNTPDSKKCFGASVAGLVEIKGKYFNRFIIDNDKQRIRLQCIEYDSLQKVFWLGSIKGLYKFEPITEKYSKVESIYENIRVTDLYYTDTALWIATKGNGLLTMQNGIIKPFILDDSDSHSSIFQILYIDNEIWLNAGLHLIRMKYERPGWRIQDYQLSHDKILGNINDILPFKGNLLIGTANGLFTFDYKSIKPKEKKIPVYITEVNINLKDTSIQSNYTLKHFQNNIKFYYSALTFFEPKKQVFSYRLKGLDDKWTITSNKEAIFHNIPPGSYTFDLKYHSPYHNKYYSAASISFTIKKPFYKTWWFILIASGLFIALIFTIQYQKIKRVRKENDFREELLDARQKALINQINPHFIFNSLNSIQLYILDNNAKLSGIYLSKFARLIRISLEVSQQNKISLSKEIEVNSLYLDMEKLRFKNRIEYEIVNNIRTNPAKVLIPPFLIQPLLENALWHGLMTKEGTKGIITLAFNKQEEQVIIKITDNGIGRKAAAELKERQNKSHKPMGISVSRRRLLLLSQQYRQNFSLSYRDLFDEQGNAAGTEATLIIPYEEIRKENN